MNNVNKPKTGSNRNFRWELEEDSGLYRLYWRGSESVRPKNERGGLVEKPENIAETAWIGDNARVYGSAQIYDNAWVYGSAKVYGDVWSTSPLYIQGSRFSLTNSRYGYVQIGCLQYSFEYWAKNYKKIGREHGFTAAEIKEYKSYIDLFRKLGK